MHCPDIDFQATNNILSTRCQCPLWCVRAGGSFAASRTAKQILRKEKTTHHPTCRFKQRKNPHDAVDPCLESGRDVILLRPVVQLHRQQRAAVLATDSRRRHSSRQQRNPSLEPQRCRVRLTKKPEQTQQKRAEIKTTRYRSMPHQKQQ